MRRSYNGPPPPLPPRGRTPPPPQRWADDERWTREWSRDRRDRLSPGPYDARAGFVGPIRSGDRRSLEPPRAAYPPDPRRDHAPEGGRDHRYEKLEPRSRYAPYPPQPPPLSRTPEPAYAHGQYAPPPLPAYSTAYHTSGALPPHHSQPYPPTSLPGGHFPHHVPPGPPAPLPYHAPPSLARPSPSEPPPRRPIDERRPADRNPGLSHNGFREKSAPAQSVIFMGLPSHVDEATLTAFLEEQGCAVEACILIRDRNTGLSKRYAFARFISVEHARSFVEPNFPLVTWKEPRRVPAPNKSEDGLKFKLDYSRTDVVPPEARRGGAAPKRGEPLAPNRGPGAKPVVPQQQAEAAPINDGARDIGGSPTSILLLRGLDPLTTEQDIAQALSGIPDPSGLLTASSVRKVMLIKDRNTRGSWGYAFVQFGDVQAAGKALSLLLSASIFPRGFQLKNKLIIVNFAHDHSFHPVYKASEWSFRSEGGQELTYWDEKAYAAVFSAPGPVGAATANAAVPQPVANGTQDAKTDAEADMDAFLSSIDAESSAQQASIGQAVTPVGTAHVQSSVGTVESLSSVAPVPAQVVPPSEEAKPQPPTAQTEDPDDFRDVIRMSCLLCQRQFKGLPELDRHVELSKLHKGNMEDEAVKTAGRERKTAQMKVYQMNGSQKPAVQAAASQ